MAEYDALGRQYEGGEVTLHGIETWELMREGCINVLLDQCGPKIPKGDKKIVPPSLQSCPEKQNTRFWGGQNSEVF